MVLLAIVAVALGFGLPTKVYAADDITMPSTNPADFSPDIIGTWRQSTDPKQVNEIIRVGSYIYVGGVIEKAKNADSTTSYAYSNVLRFVPSSSPTTPDRINTTFKPRLYGPDGTSFSGEVLALEATPDNRYLYIGGSFTTVDGRSVTGIVKWDVVNNVQDMSFKSKLYVSRPTGDKAATVYDIKYFKGMLIVASNATKIVNSNGQTVLGTSLMSLNPVTGDKTSYLNLAPTNSVVSTGIVSVEKVAINPAGTRMVVIGNFRKVAGIERLQIAMLNLGTTSATLASWYPKSTMANSTVNTDGTAPKTAQFPLGNDKACVTQTACLRDVDWAPSGSWFTVCGTGGVYAGANYPSISDSISRWENTDSLSDPRPTWVNYSPADTFLSCRATANTVFTGGHFKQLNFAAYYKDVRQFKGIYTVQDHYGIGAINASNGSAIASFNPSTEGVTGRGYGWTGMYVSAPSRGAGSGLWVGGDTDLIMNETHMGLGHFPLQ